MRRRWTALQMAFWTKNDGFLCGLCVVWFEADVRGEGNRHQQEAPPPPLHCRLEPGTNSIPTTKNPEFTFHLDSSTASISQLKIL